MNAQALEQGSQEWLDLRTRKIGASDAAAILGLSPWMTPLQLFEIKMGYTTVVENFAMKRGKTMEPYARSKLEELLAISLKPSVIFHPEYNFLMASLDASSDDGTIIAEIKCPGEEDHRIAQNGLVPAHYYPQLQHQMMVANVPSAYYFSHTVFDDVLLKVEADPTFQTMMLEKEKEFYECMRTLTPPEMSDRDYVLRDDQEWKKICNNYKLAKQCADAAEKDLEYWKNEMIKSSGEKNTKGAGVKITKVIRKGNVDYSKIEVLKNVDLEPYRKSAIVSWRISEEK